MLINVLIGNRSILLLWSSAFAAMVLQPWPFIVMTYLTSSTCRTRATDGVFILFK